MKPNYIKMTYDIVFKKFFIDKPKLLKLILKHFLDIDFVQDIIITNPEIPELEEIKHKEKQLIEEDQEKSLTIEEDQEKSLTIEENQEKSLTIEKNQEKSLTTEENQEKSLTIEKNQEKSLTTEENQEKSLTIEKNQEKSLTTTGNNQNTKEFSFLDSSLPAESSGGKRVFLDLRVKLSTGEDINVEVQTTYKKHFLNRILYYWAKLHSQSLKKGEGYDKITPTYSLIFTEKSFLDKRVKDFMSSFSIRRDEEPYILFNKDLRIVIVELSKLDKARSDLFDFKEFWCYFLKKSGELTKEDRKHLSRHKELEEAMKHFDKLSQEEKLQQIALDQHMTEVIHDLDRSGWIEEGMQKGIEKGMQKGIEKGMQKGIEKGMQKGIEEGVQEGIEKGMQKGREEGVQKGIEKGMQKGREEGVQEGIERGMQKGREDLILKMLEKGCSVFEISQITDLSEAEILELNDK